MFLIHCLGVLTVVFWLSALVAEAFMDSPAERGLSPGVRVGFGFILTFMYFSAAWQLFDVAQAWVVGIAVLALQAVARSVVAPARDWPARARRFWEGYRSTFGLAIAAAVVFFMPLIVAQNFGPFTEGGGDVSIYADTAKYMTDRSLTEFGLPSTGAPDFERNLRELALQGGGERPGAQQSPFMNPPFPEFGAYRILVTRTMSPFLYTPYAAYSFMAGATNYAVFYGIQCFVYGILLAAAWSFFLRYGRRIAAAGLVLVACSHSVVSIFYNTYATQTVALAMCALVLASLAHVPLRSWPGLRTYGTILLLTWITYVHYLSVMLPMVCVALIAPAAGWQATQAARAARSGVARFAGVLTGAVMAFAFATLAWAGTLKSWQIGSILLRGAASDRMSKEVLTYMGIPVEPFGNQWLAFVFGFVSQQHFLPYVIEYAGFDQLLAIGNAAGIACLVIGMAAMARWFLARRGRAGSALQDFAIFAMALFTVVVHLYLVRNSLYTQAKGAQNVLVLVYTVMLLPLALLCRDMPHGSLSIGMQRALTASLVVLAAALFFLRGEFGYRLALELDRSGILGPSFFAEAERIRRSDPDPLVLFEPRRSADLYASSQPFFGARMLPTRELILQKSITAVQGSYDSRIATAVEFIEPQDLPHLWTLRAETKPRWPLMWRLRGWFRPQAMPYVYSWHAERLLDLKEPALVLSGDTFERPYGELHLGASPAGPLALFDFIRKGVASLYVPAGRAAMVEVEMQPREGEYAALEAEMRGRADAGEFGSDAVMTTTGKVVRIAYRIAAAPAPTLRIVAHSKGEAFVNVKVDGRDTR